jgi:maltose/moltooligosaccharide transporter
MGLMSLWVVTDRYVLFASMAGVGIAWASILSMPYAMLANVLPENKMGTYMGAFNFFIVIPQIIIALTSGIVMERLLGGQQISMVILGGALMAIAALLMRRVKC